MKAITRRIRRLEDRFVPRDAEGSPLADLLRAREKCWAEMEGRPYVEEDEPREDTRGMTLAEVLRYDYQCRPEAGALRIAGQKII